MTNIFINDQTFLLMTKHFYSWPMFLLMTNVVINDQWFYEWLMFLLMTNIFMTIFLLVTKNVSLDKCKVPHVQKLFPVNSR